MSVTVPNREWKYNVSIYNKLGQVIVRINIQQYKNAKILNFIFDLSSIFNFA